MDIDLNSREAGRYTQPISSEFTLVRDGKQEYVDYLPGTSCRIWYTIEDFEFDEHWHTALEIIVCENGYYDLVVDNKPYRLFKDDIIIVPPGITHSLSLKDNCNGFIYIMDASILSNVKSAATVMYILSNPIFITEKENPQLHTAISALLSQMKTEYFSDNNMRELLVFSRLLMLAAEIGNHHFDSDKNLPHVRPDRRKECMDRLNEVLFYINRHYMDDLSIEMLSRHFGFSRYYFARLFKQFTRMTFGEYLMHQRIKAAEYFLSQPNMSITDIAYQTGFSSISTFSRVFKQIKNCTPSRFRGINQR